MISLTLKLPILNIFVFFQTMKIETALKNDIPALDVLVNKGYRGDSSRKGWTTEADLLDGLRTDAKALEALMNESGSYILKVVNQQGTIIACVNLKEKGTKLYLGMLTVDPELQGAGIGKQLLKAAEEKAIDLQKESIIMTVITIRKELIDWYNRHGYTDTGLREPFPTGDPSFGAPKQPLEFMVLEKKRSDF